MSDATPIAASGTWGTVEWATDARGAIPAREFYLRLTDQDKEKVLRLFKRLADTGRITNQVQFKQLGQKAGPRGQGLWEFKSFQTRFIGDFRPGRRFIVAHGTTKKGDDLRQADVEKAVRVLAEHDARGGGVK